MEIIPQLLEKIIWQADHLAKLGAIASWIIFTIYLIIERAWTQKIQREAADNATEARKAEAQAAMMLANGVNKLAEKYDDLCYEVRELGGKIK